MNQWHQIEDPDVNPHTYKHQIFDKWKLYNRKKKASSTNGNGMTGCGQYRIMQIDP